MGSVSSKGLVEIPGERHEPRVGWERGSALRLPVCLACPRDHPRFCQHIIINFQINVFKATHS